MQGYSLITTSGIKKLTMRGYKAVWLFLVIPVALFSCRKPTPPKGYLEASLLQSTLQGDLRSAREAIKKGASPNIRTPDSEPLISYAIKSGNFDFALFLLDHGASGSKVGYFYSDPPFFHAMKANHLMLTTILLEKYPESLFLITSPEEFSSYGNIENIPEDHRSLIQTTYKNHKSNYKKWIRLGLASQDNDLQLFKKLSKEESDLFKNHSPNATFFFSELVFHEKIEFMSCAIDLGFDINSKTAKGNTPLIEAYASKRSASFNFLIKRGADINIPNERLDTLLHLAVLRKDKTTVEKLLKLGAKPNRYNLLQVTPLSMAISLEAYQIESLLRRHRAVDFPWPALSP
ncbi:ankyrin repeat domain-containing protein [Acanthopleuribacter pedis]|uniref:Ankyrin repeat protein n=1 Tax=Acanthopleuribacter pedis TaxID=442870 RepID=A0A8J7U6G7_9BACT|nr:hypothetical protein [Acanthopleuribacter pedis]MBO1320346.1 hypothetical protein [Acanthopleuribacter pedis]